HPRRFQLPVAVLVAAALLACTRPAPAGDPEDDAGPVLAAAEEAVAHGRVVQSNQLGFGNDKGAFSDAPEDAGVLIGFDLGVGKFFDVETIYAIRAVFLTRGGEEILKDHGLFRNKTLPKKILK